MANFYYVKSGGTATGDAGRVATTKSTGSFTTKGVAAYYDSVTTALAATTAPASGDFITASNSHLKSYTVTTINTIPDGVTLVSVDDANCENYLAGAEEKTTGTDIDLSIVPSVAGVFHSDGFNFGSEDDLKGNQNNSSIDMSNGKLELYGTSSSDLMQFSIDGVDLSATNIDLKFGHSSQYFYMSGGAKIHFNGGELLSNQTYLVRSLGNGGATAIIENYDLSILTGIVFNLLNASNDICQYTLSRCKLNASTSLVSAIYYKGQTVDAYSCDTGDGYHYFEHHRYEGVVLESTTIKRTGGATYDGSTGFSVEFQPNANVMEFVNPLKIKLGDYELDLTSANTLTFHLAMQDTATITPSTITNDKYWIELVQNDATDNALGITIDTKPTGIFTTPSALANVATTWTGRTLTYEDEFQIPVTTTVVTGLTTGQVTAYLCVAEHVSTREIYACPSPVIT